MILVVEHLVFSDEFVAPDDQMGFHDQIQFLQQVLDLLRAFDVDGSGRMAELDLHGKTMISPPIAGSKRPLRGACPAEI